MFQACTYAHMVQHTLNITTLKRFQQCCILILTEFILKWKGILFFSLLYYSLSLAYQTSAISVSVSQSLPMSYPYYLLLAMYRLEFMDGTPTFQTAWCPSYFRLIPRYPHGNTLLFSFSNLWKKSLMQTQLRPYSPGQFIRYIKSQFRLNLEHPSPSHKS